MRLTNYSEGWDARPLVRFCRRGRGTMQFRRPSTASSTTLTSGSIRRRVSPVCQPIRPTPETESDGETVVLRPHTPMEKRDRSAHETPTLPPLDFEPRRGSRREAWISSTSTLGRYLSAGRSVRSHQSSAADIPRLPTPNFPPEEEPRFVGVVTPSRDGLGCLKWQDARRESSVSDRERENTKSEGGFSRSRSALSAVTRSTHQSLSSSTTGRLTQKWPAPQSFRRQETVRGDATLEAGDGQGVGKRGRWPLSKWCLFLSVIGVLSYGGVGMAYAILTWFRAWDQADVMYVADSDILILVTLCSSILLFTALLGITGTFLNSRPILATYAVLLWACFISMLAIGYTAYKRSAFALDRKLNSAWSQWYTPVGRLMIQDSLRCCGFYSALHDATPSPRCYARTMLPGCKSKLYRFETHNLQRIWAAVFGLVPVHIANMIVALLCANHVTETFGKRIMPKKYWLSRADLTGELTRMASANY